MRFSGSVAWRAAPGIWMCGAGMLVVLVRGYGGGCGGSRFCKYLVVALCLSQSYCGGDHCPSSFDEFLDFRSHLELDRQSHRRSDAARHRIQRDSAHYMRN